MSKRIAQALSFALVLSSGEFVCATADGPDHYRVQRIAAGSSLNLRAAPDAASQRIGRVPANANCIRNLGCQGGLTLEESSTLTGAEKRQRATDRPRWCKVEYAGVVGWAAGRYLAEGDCSNLRQ